MRKGPLKPPHDLSCEINQFLYEKDRGESLTALIVSLGLQLKRTNRSYPDYRAARQDVISRLMQLTDISETEFKETVKMLDKIKEAA